MSKKEFSSEINWKEIAMNTQAELWQIRNAADQMALAIQYKGWSEQSKALNEYRALRGNK